MEKRRIGLFITIIGVLVIIISNSFIKYSKSMVITEQDYITGKLKSLAKKCIIDEKCNKTNITIDNLINNNYISDDLLEKLKDCAKDSYIVYPTYEVVLLEAD